jgi:aminoglycoside phosphotransferase (APT) family kinase protein
VSDVQPHGDEASSDEAEIQSVVHRSSRDMEVFRAALQRALAGHLTAGTDHHVGELEGTSATGMSSETLLFDATWKEAGETRCERLVARVAPDPHDVPVFPRYDLPGQFRTIETVARHTDVPVPPPWWCEPDPNVIGAPFFVMGRVDGQVPPDVLPYNFGDSWLFNASPAEQARLQDSTIDVLARLHSIDNPQQRFAHLDGNFPGDTPLRRHFAGRREWYEWATKDTGRSKLVEKGFAWLEDHWPAHESSMVFCWGDSRIGNVLYRDFEPAAVLDWEMAALGPPELDVAWLIYLHRMFEEMAQQYGFPGMPGFLRADDAATTYERISGHTPRDLDWYITYSSLQLAIVYLRTGHRSVHFGERAAPLDADELLLNGPTLAALVERA